ncbi:REP-associated tyrosine transposase [Methylocucumis oryzae]|uniref:Transposase n=1 Tax=Methylocucumis oryzae TaxID=1632867 RepID=A0A0F3IGL1_9GAMM|nr:transposase [Methylocucumis oryzae]KJV05668.1 transposase [Methylocucumis oryzae]
MQYRRLYQPGARYFFTVVTENRQPILIEHIERLRAAFRLCKSRYPFEIDAIVVLPEHLHTLWRLPENDDDFSKRWMVIKRKFSAGLPSRVISDSKTKKREKGIWQRRFWEHYIRDENDWRQHVDYIHFNPVKHGYVSRPQDWPYSSFNQAVHKGWYEPGIELEDQFIQLNHENIGNE